MTTYKVISSVCDNEFVGTLEECQNWIDTHCVKREFEDGSFAWIEPAEEWEQGLYKNESTTYEIVPCFVEARKIYYYEFKNTLYGCDGDCTDMEKWQAARVSYSENRKMEDNPFHLNAREVGLAAIESGRAEIRLEEKDMNWGSSYMNILFVDGEEVARQSAGHFDAASKDSYSRSMDSDGNIYLEECSREYRNNFQWEKLPIEILIKLK